jgi:hypothetical protein
MVGSLFNFFVATGLLAAPAAGGFTFEGREASARTVSSAGFFAQGPVPYPDLYERGQGSASLTVEDRVGAPGATYGDKAQVEAQFRLGVTEYRVELTQAGFPPPQAAGAAPAQPPVPRPGHPLEGGVILNRDLNGDSGLGWMATTRVHAAIAVWGVGRVLRNGQLLTDNAVIHVAALSHGAQADDETHRTLPLAREGDAELHVLVWNLPLSVEPRGFIQFSFEDVEIMVDGVAVRTVARVPTVSGAEAWTAAPVTTGGAGQGGLFLPPSPPPPLGAGVGGAGFDTTVAPVTGTPGGPVTPVSPGTIGGPASVDPFAVPGVAVGTQGTLAGTAAPGVPGVPGAPISGPVTPAVTVGPGAVTPDTISGTFPTTGAPTPSANISGTMPGTAAPGSVLAEEAPVPVGAPPPGGPAESGVALSQPPPTLSTLGTFSVPALTPPDFSAFAGTSQVSPGIIATPPPLGSDPTTPTPPLLGSPGPITASPAPPLLGSPAPLNAAPPPALISTPPPVNAIPGAATSAPVAPGPVAPAPAPGGSVPPPGGSGVPPSI